MKRLPWILLVISIVVFVFGAIVRISGAAVFAGLPLDPGTYWKGAMALVIYAIAFHMFRETKSSAP